MNKKSLYIILSVCVLAIIASFVIFTFSNLFPEKAPECIGDTTGELSRSIIDNHLVYLDEFGNIAIQTYYDDGYSHFTFGVSIVENNEMYGVMDSSCNLIIDLEYDSIELIDMNDSPFYITKNNDGYRLINLDGTPIINEIFDDISTRFITAWWTFVGMRVLSEAEIDSGSILNHYLVKLNGKWGIIDYDGSYILEPIYDRIENFNFEYLSISIDGLWGIVGWNDEIKLPIVYSELRYYDRIFADANGLYGILDDDANIVVEPYYDEIRVSYSQVVNNQGYIISKDGQSGLMDQDYNTIIELKYEEMLILDNYILAKYHGYYGLININEDVLIDYLYDEIIPCTSRSWEINLNNFMAMKNDLWGIIDVDNNIIIPLQYKSINAYEHIIIVSNNGQYGVIDYSGNVLIDLIYSNVTRISDTEYRVEIEIPFGFSYETIILE